MGLSGYSSAHCPPTTLSESNTWAWMPSSPSSKTWNSPQGPAPMIATVVAGSPSGPTCIGIRGGMEVLALRCQLIDEAFELGHPALGGADGHAVLAARVPAGLSGIQPILQC